MFAALAENFGNLREKVNLFVALAPVIRLDNATNDWFVKLGNNVDRAQFWLNKLGIHELYGPGWQKLTFE